MKVVQESRASGAPIAVQRTDNSHLVHQYAEILAEEVPYNEAPMEKALPGYIYSDRDLLCIEHLAKLPTDVCIKSNQAADHVVTIFLRNPADPESWWGRCPRKLTFGLSSFEKIKFQFQSGFAKLGLLSTFGAFWAGLFVNPLFFAVGIGTFFGSSILNAMTPVRYREVSRELTTLKGVSREYLRRFDQVDHSSQSSDSAPSHQATPHHSPPR